MASSIKKDSKSRDQFDKPKVSERIAMKKYIYKKRTPGSLGKKVKDEKKEQEEKNGNPWCHRNSYMFARSSHRLQTNIPVERDEAMTL